MGNLDLFHKLHRLTSMCQLLAFIWDLDQPKVLDGLATKGLD